MGVIYLRTNLVNGMQYVGQTKDFPKRERAWKCLKLRYGNQLLNEDRNEYGLDAFKTTILKECESQEELNRWEKHYVKFFNTLYPNGYNDNEGGTICFHHSERTKQKISEANSGEKNGMFGKQPWNKGIQWNEEIRGKISKANIGNKCALGHTLSEETKKIISEKKKGIPNSKLAKPLVQIKPNGDVVTFESVADARNNGFKSVDRVCRGERPKAYGCEWFYLEDYQKC